MSRVHDTSHIAILVHFKWKIDDVLFSSSMLLWMSKLKVVNNAECSKLHSPLSNCIWLLRALCVCKYVVSLTKIYTCSKQFQPFIHFYAILISCKMWKEKELYIYLWLHNKLSNFFSIKPCIIAHILDFALSSLLFSICLVFSLLHIACSRLVFIFIFLLHLRKYTGR